VYETNQVGENILNEERSMMDEAKRVPHEERWALFYDVSIY
jgi:hypothetical protein